MDQVIAILQARMRSERLPGKILADIAAGRCSPRLSSACTVSAGMDRVVLAIPREDLPHLWNRLARECGAEIHPGSAHDVLQRYYTAAKSYPAP